MKLVRHEIAVIEANCTGCYLCENVCPTGAMTLEGPKSSAIAVVDNDKCIGCFRCIDVCDDDALLSNERERPIRFGIDPATVDQAALGELLLKTSSIPDGTACVCSFTTNREIAAAIVAGARTPQEVSLATGAQAGCLMYCFAPIHRMLTAQWGSVPPPPAKNKWYDSSLSLADVPDEVCERHQDFHVAEEKAALEEIVGKKVAALVGAKKPAADGE